MNSSRNNLDSFQVKIVLPTNCATSLWKSLSLSKETKTYQTRKVDREQERKKKRNKGEKWERRQEVSLGAVNLAEKRDPNGEPRPSYAVNRPNEVAKRSGIPKSVIVHRAAVEVA